MSGLRSLDVASIGVDVGYLYAKVVALDGQGDVAYCDYRRHNGDYAATVAEQLEPVSGFSAAPVCLTGTESRLWRRGDGNWLHDARALAVAVSAAGSGARSVLHIGASGVALISLDDEGQMLAYETNTLCAAGTGSFLDEQAERLGVDYQQPVEADPGDEIPTIATRCTVFAKSDLIHRQQEGCSREAMWVGLCRSMTATLFQTLLKGRDLPGKTVITGGVSLNRFVVDSARARFPDRVDPLENGHLAAAHGAALHGQGGTTGLTLAELLGILANGSGKEEASFELRPELRLLRSKYPSFEVAEELVDEFDNEIRVDFSARNLSGSARVFVGIDIGSTSTKLAVLDEHGDVLCDIYRRTAGAPIVATRACLTALSQVFEARGIELEIGGVATTGSGRKLVGKVFGADVIINEITAHARGASSSVSGEVETIFEIGGQDAKYIRMHDGQIRDSNMNFVCSAGTGSFVEEQARKLGIPVQEVGRVTEGIAPPSTSDRCTVFMEQDVAKLMAAGYSTAEAMAAVLYSVVKNYLNKVVGNRPISRDRVVFQGATARNRGLVAAFENLLGVEVVVSPYCHVMGCIGAAKVAMERVKGKSSFIGLDRLDAEVTIAHSYCDLCTNSCRITHARMSGSDDEASWGYMCGREPGESARGMKWDRAFRKMDSMVRRLVANANRNAGDDRPVIGLPQSLSTFGLLPFWAGFLGELGCRTKLDGHTDDEVKELGASLSAADFCFPVKAHLGHMRRVLKDPEVDFALVPYFISDAKNKFTSNSLVCPYVESSPSVYRAAGDGFGSDRLISPVIDFRWARDRQAKALRKCLEDAIPGLTQAGCKRALAAAHRTQDEFFKQAVDEGERLLEAARQEGSPVVVFVGRPYNVRDLGLNLTIPRLVAQHGCYVMPHEMLPFKPELLGEEFSNVYWAYGQRILSALRQVGAAEDLYGVYLSNFNCGPDSFLLSYAEEIQKDKPFLVLELDEHGSEGGYLTRIEAFLDVIDSVGGAVSERRIRTLRVNNGGFKARKIWFPAMHPITARMFAAAFRCHGYDAEMMPVETPSAFERGRGVTRGSECLPTCSTIGQFLTLMKDRQLDPEKQAFFMATATGPCRFGQYELLHRTILDREGYTNIPIMSPSSFNSYQGLGERLRRLAFRGLLIADLLFKARCKTAPYETQPGAADRMLEEGTREFEAAMENGDKLEPVMKSVMERFSQIPVAGPPKPLVGIVGEIYVRCNPFTNDNLVEEIERFGGEAWLAPVCEWFLYTSQTQAWLSREGLNGLAARGLSLLKNRFLNNDEKHWYSVAGDFLADRHEPSMKAVLGEGLPYFPLNFEGEAIITLGRAVLFAQQGADLVVNAGPFGCMPGTLTTAIMRKLQEDLGVPMVGMFYDGTPGLNKVLEPFIAGCRERKLGAAKKEARLVSARASRRS